MSVRTLPPSNSEQRDQREHRRITRHDVSRLRSLHGRQKRRSNQEIAEHKRNPPKIRTAAWIICAAFLSRAPNQPEPANRKRDVHVPQRRESPRNEDIRVRIFPLLAQGPELAV